MKTPITALRSVPFGWLIAAMAFALTASPVHADRDLGGTWYWVPRTDIAPNCVQFNIYEVHRLNSGQLTPLPDSPGDEYQNIDKTGNFNFGDCVNNGFSAASRNHFGLPEDDYPAGGFRACAGVNGSVLSSSDQKYRVIAINENENWVVSQLIDRRTNNPPIHTYGVTNFTGWGIAPDGSQRFDWFKAGSYPLGLTDPRLGKSEPNLPPYDQQNHERFYRLGSCVWPSGAGANDVPTSPQINMFQASGINVLGIYGINQWQITTDDVPSGPSALFPSGITRTIRLPYVPDGEAGHAAFAQPPGLTVSGNPLESAGEPLEHYHYLQSSSFLEWNTTGQPDGSMWSYTVVVEDWADAFVDDGFGNLVPAEPPPDANTSSLDSLVTYSQLCQELQVCASNPDVPPVLTITSGGSCGLNVVDITNPIDVPVEINRNRVPPGDYVSVSHSSPNLTPSVLRTMVVIKPKGIPPDTVIHFGYSGSPAPAPVGLAFFVQFDAVDACGLAASCQKIFRVVNSAPDCDSMFGCVPNPHFNDGNFQLVTLSGAKDPDQAASTLKYTVPGGASSVTSDESAGPNCPDAIVVNGLGPNGGDQVWVRVERQQGEDGRIYRIPVTVTDSDGGSCSDTAFVCIPLNGTDPCPLASPASGPPCHDSGVFFPAAPGSCPLSPGDRPSLVGMEQQKQLPKQVQISRIGQSGDGLTLEFGLPQDSDVSLNVYDLAGRNLATLVSGRREAGVHRAEWNVRGLPKGIYYYRLRAGTVTLSRSVYIP